MLPVLLSLCIPTTEPSPVPMKVLTNKATTSFKEKVHEGDIALQAMLNKSIASTTELVRTMKDKDPVVYAGIIKSLLEGIEEDRRQLAIIEARMNKKQDK